MLKATNSRLPSSYRDPCGFVFEEQGEVLRQVNQIYQRDYDNLIESGLYGRLVESKQLLSHDEIDFNPLERPDAYKILHPERIPFISYPYEWTFGQLKDAALVTLGIQMEALDFGMTLKDANAYNIQFHKGRPVFIDTLSFKRYQEGEPWVGYRQFCQHFLGPLALMSYKHIDLSQLFRVYMDGIPLDLAHSLLPKRTLLKPSMNMHIHMHAKFQKKSAKSQIAVSRSSKKFSLMAFRGLIDSLESAVKGLSWSPGGTEWADYEMEDSYVATALEHKLQLVAGFLKEVRPRSVWDLGSNTGRFSRLASERGCLTISFDKDPSAVEKNYADLKNRKDENLLPLLQDLTNPSPRIGWANQERMDLFQRGPADMLFALALIHHLAISENVPLDMIARFFSRIANWAIVEFVPKNDKQARRLLISRDDIFPDYNQDKFETEFSKFFQIRCRQRIDGSDRTLYLMEGHGSR